MNFRGCMSAPCYAVTIQCSWQMDIDLTMMIGNKQMLEDEGTRMQTLVLTLTEATGAPVLLAWKWPG